MSASLDPNIYECLERIEAKLSALLNEKQTAEQSHYSTSDVAKLLGKAEWTVREWCRLGRVHANKRAAGRGVAKEWMISHEEFCRIKAEGLLPLQKFHSFRYRPS